MNMGNKGYKFGRRFFGKAAAAKTAAAAAATGDENTHAKNELNTQKLQDAKTTALARLRDAWRKAHNSEEHFKRLNIILAQPETYFSIQEEDFVPRETKSRYQKLCEDRVEFRNELTAYQQTYGSVTYRAFLNTSDKGNENTEKYAKKQYGDLDSSIQPSRLFGPTNITEMRNKAQAFVRIHQTANRLAEAINNSEHEGNDANSIVAKIITNEKGSDKEDLSPDSLEALNDRILGHMDHINTTIETIQKQLSQPKAQPPTFRALSSDKTRADRYLARIKKIIEKHQGNTPDLSLTTENTTHQHPASPFLPTPSHVYGVMLTDTQQAWLDQTQQNLQGITEIKLRDTPSPHTQPQRS